MCLELEILEIHNTFLIVCLLVFFVCFICSLLLPCFVFFFKYEIHSVVPNTHFKCHNTVATFKIVCNLFEMKQELYIGKWWNIMMQLCSSSF